MHRDAEPHYTNKKTSFGPMQAYPQVLVAMQTMFTILAQLKQAAPWFHLEYKSQQCWQTQISVDPKIEYGFNSYSKLWTWKSWRCKKNLCIRTNRYDHKWNNYWLAKSDGYWLHNFFLYFWIIIFIVLWFVGIYFWYVNSCWKCVLCFCNLCLVRYKSTLYCMFNIFSVFKVL